MSEITRFKVPSEAIKLNFVERVHTPTDLMRLAVQIHLGGLSLSEIRLMGESFGVDRARSTIHYWVKKSDLEPAGGCKPDQVALDEMVVKVNGERFWLFGAVNPETGRILHVGLFPHRTIVTTKIFLDELTEKHDVKDVEFLVDGTIRRYDNSHEDTKGHELHVAPDPEPKRIEFPGMVKLWERFWSEIPKDPLDME